MKIQLCAVLLMTAVLGAADADPLKAALALPDGDAFAPDRMQEALMLAPRGQRAVTVERIIASGREDAYGILHRLILDDDPACAVLAVDALAKRWPTAMADVEAIRPLIARDGTVGAAACRYAAQVGDDEALSALADRIFRLPGDPDAEAALRRLLNMPSGCGPDGWMALVDSRAAKTEAALSSAERLVAGSAEDAMGAITLIAGMRPAGSRGARVLLAATEHPDVTVRRMAASILTTCDAPAAAAWRARRDAEMGDAGSALAGVRPLADSDAPMVAAARPSASTPAAPAVAAAAPTASKSSAWIVWLTVIGLLAGGAWLALRRRGVAGKPVDAPASNGKARITWAN